MAIDNIKKTIFFVPENVYEEFLIELKENSCVEIIPSSHQLQNLKDDFLGFKYEEIKSLKSKLENVFAIFSKLNITYPNIEIKEEQIISKNSQEIKEIKNLCEKIEELDSEIKNLQLENHSLESKRELLLPFREVKFNFEKIINLKYSKFFFIKVDSKKYKEFLNELSKINLVSILWNKKIRYEVFLLLVVYIDEEKKVSDIIKQYEAHSYDLIHQVETSIEEEICKIEKKIKVNNDKIAHIKEEIKKIGFSNLKSLLTLYLKCLELEDFISTQQNFKSTRYFKIIYCWTPEKFLKKIKNLTEKFSKEISVIFLEPSDDEDVPVVLENKKYAQPYEFITKLYGYPKFKTIDPTEFLAPFFTIFFSLCVSDVFYGFILFLLWIFLRKKIPKDSEYYNLVVLFKYLGVSSVLVGFTLDSFLGFSIVKNLRFPFNFVLFDPLNKPIDMLKFTFLLGFIQVIFGLFISFSKNIKDKNYLSAIDNLSWILFIIVFAPTVYNLFFPKDVSEKLIRLSNKLSIVLFLFIVIFQSREIKSVILKPVNFFVKAYNTIGYYADMLSYSRILALALASSAIAQTINMLVAKLLKAELLGIKFLEPAIAPLLFLGGHLFNFVMGVLGGLVHSARLQYLEFFSKFFVSGGRPIKLFAPLKK
ncbi:MAG: V-type ATPase 116kDa subunit family protein [Elusimicrobiota bacterium]|nr:hypothetical protein [Endomicrobiia bacterium]MDW8165937.1 V-type ATPase 116kDa subunit family protein [Elusimicrobiota bacterium]